MSEGKLRVPGRGSQAAQARWMVGLLAMDDNSGSMTEVTRYFGRDVSPDPTKKLKYARPWSTCHESFSHRGDGSVTSLTVSFRLHGANHSSTWSGAQLR